MREAVRICMDMARQQAMAEIIESCIDPTDTDLESDDALDDLAAGKRVDSHHISGTCKMGPESDPTAVVDQFGRVHGLDGLRGADASIMPDCIRANTNVTSMAIGERVADFMNTGTEPFVPPSMNSSKQRVIFCLFHEVGAGSCPPPPPPPLAKGGVRGDFEAQHVCTSIWQIGLISRLPRRTVSLPLPPGPSVTPVPGPRGNQIRPPSMRSAGVTSSARQGAS